MTSTIRSGNSVQLAGFSVERLTCPKAEDGPPRATEALSAAAATDRKPSPSGANSDLRSDSNRAATYRAAQQSSALPTALHGRDGRIYMNGWRPKLKGEPPSLVDVFLAYLVTLYLLASLHPPPQKKWGTPYPVVLPPEVITGHGVKY